MDLYNPIKAAFFLPAYVCLNYKHLYTMSKSHDLKCQTQMCCIFFFFLHRPHTAIHAAFPYKVETCFNNSDKCAFVLDI